MDEATKQYFYEAMSPVYNAMVAKYPDADERDYLLDEREDFTKGFYEWLDESTPAELDALKEVLKVLKVEDDEVPSVLLQRERKVIITFISNMMRDNDSDIRPYLHGLLAHREAYTQESGLTSHFNHFTPLSCYLGLFNLDSNNRTITLKYSKEETIAILRYEFEIANGWLNIENSPVTLTSVALPLRKGETRSSNNRTWKFNDPNLPDLIARNAHRVEELILIAKVRGTHDPSIMEDMLNTPSHPSLLSGRL